MFHHNVISGLSPNLLKSSKPVICVGAGLTTREFLLECRESNKSLYKRILYCMDDDLSKKKLLDKKIIPISKDISDDFLYLIVTSVDSIRYILKDKLYALGIDKKKIFTHKVDFYITKNIMKEFNDLTYNVIECGASNITPQIYVLKDELLNSINIHAFEPDANEIKRLKSNNEYSQYNYYNAIVDKPNQKSRKLHQISLLKDGSWTFHKPNEKHTDKYRDFYSREKHSVYKTVSFNNITTIDKVVKKIDEDIDYLYINIDSAELYALQGAEKSLKNSKISIVEVETYFNRYYKGQPLFDKVNRLMCKNGYELLSLNKANNNIPISSPFKIDGEKIVHMNGIYIRKNIKIKNIQQIVILELLGFPLSAFDALLDLYNSLSNKKKLKKSIEKVIYKSYQSYKNHYDEFLSFDEFIKFKDS